MKTIILVRHAKSSWKHPEKDRNRRLKKKGIADANLVSSVFAKKKLSIDMSYSSPAKRAEFTCDIFANQLNIDTKKIIISDDLYDFGGQKVIHFIKNLHQNLNTVMIFGHNHALTSVCNIFGDIFIDNLPTSGLAVIDFDVDTWSSITFGITRFTIFPRNLK